MCGQLGDLLQSAIAKIEKGGEYSADEMMLWFYNVIICHDQI
jgi:hypothetical protein